MRARRVNVKLADPSLRPIAVRILDALSSGHLPEVSAGRSYLAAGPGALPQLLDQRSTDHVPLLVLEGPTPRTALRVPASLVLVPFDSETVSDQLCGKDGAEGALVSLFRQTEGLDLKSRTAVAGWRALGLQPASAGEASVPGDAGTDLADFFQGKTADRPKSSFWQRVQEACSSANISFEDLQSLLLATRTAWFSPYTGKPLPAAEAIEVYALIRDQWQENDVPSHCYGAQYWNHPSIGATFSGMGGATVFHETWPETVSAAQNDGGRILSWAGRTETAFEVECRDKEIPLARIEDGFLRSVGLGAGLARGAMLAVDDLGIYYDPSRPSRLEILLKNYEVTDEERARGQRLIDLITAARVSKYNFGKVRGFDFPNDRLKILVPGQVADDAAIRKSKSETIDCAHTPNVNLDLLRLARERNPDAFLVFKPHPDVETGLRKGSVPRETAHAYADVYASDANIIDLIDAVDAVETFSSLSGFEALLRGKAVTVHGAPFYAGWGLSEDLTAIAGRGRRRSLPELVYLALVQYARTIDPVSMLPCSPEFLVHRLSEQRKDRKHLLVTSIKRRASWLGRKLGL
ncbi:capsular polysaccharide export protein, LipB/KpsS family [Roseibium sp. M-1]